MSNSSDFIHQFLVKHPNDLIFLENIRGLRAKSAEFSQAAFHDIFQAPSTLLSPALKYFLAARIANASGNVGLAAHYTAQSEFADLPETAPWWHVLLDYVDTLTLEPQHTQRQQLQDLQQAGWAVADIVLLAQLSSFVAFQVRLIQGLSILLDHHTSSEPPSDLTAIRAHDWNHHSTTSTGQTGVTDFTQEVLGWEAWLRPRDLDQLSVAEQAVLDRYGLLQKGSAYFLLLSHQLDILEKRTVIDRDIFYSQGGLEKWLREFSAVISSKVNGCIYCASVHARKASIYAKAHADDVQRLLDTPAGQVLANSTYSEKLQQIIEFNAALATTPIQLNASHVQGLRQFGFSDQELLDFIQATAFFAWANRLMLSLGEPFHLPETVVA
ncbi:peroxidase-related enzyme [Acinetobacter sp. ME22]|uniref:peroxidase-related enzyme n=1 Tax=Acinetobacter sp. ME22 TaxID=2904802 RepID=UPI001EDA966F|nr:peroxidase-related enzyme [Acinetobacter sp. ME22]MCG2572124.1 peroxidase-related enzyme [Acinetobacter sp. ME22]